MCLYRGEIFQKRDEISPLFYAKKHKNEYL